MRPDRARVAPAAVALVVLGVSAVLGSEQRYVRGEGAVVDAVNEWPRALGAPLELVMPLGTLAAALVLTALVAVATLHWRPTAAVLLAGFAGWRLDNLAKEVVERPRPAAVLADITLRDSHATGHGFPSGHTATAFALAAALHAIVPPRWRWLPWVLAAAVGVARMYVGAHFPMDVVGGAALGIAVGLVAGLLVPSRYRRRAR